MVQEAHRACPEVHLLPESEPVTVFLQYERTQPERDDGDDGGALNVDDVGISDAQVVDTGIEGGARAVDSGIGGGILPNDAGIGAGAQVVDAGIGGGAVAANAAIGGGALIVDAGTGGGTLIVDVIDGGAMIVDAGIGGGTPAVDAGIGGSALFVDADVGGGALADDAGIGGGAPLADAGALVAVADICLTVWFAASRALIATSSATAAAVDSRLAAFTLSIAPATSFAAFSTSWSQASCAPPCCRAAASMLRAAPIPRAAVFMLGAALREIRGAVVMPKTSKPGCLVESTIWRMRRGFAEPNKEGCTQHASAVRWGVKNITKIHVHRGASNYLLEPASGIRDSSVRRDRAREQRAREE